MNNMAKRVLVALLCIPGLLYILYSGGLAIIILFFIVSVIGFYEYIRMMQRTGAGISYFWLIVNAIVYLALVFSRKYDLSILWFVFVLSLITSMLFWSGQRSIQGMLAGFFGVIYTGMMPALIVRISADWQNKKILLALILMIWIVDTSAYFIGMSFGKHRNITKISPMKSIEGFIAGCLAPFIVVLCFKVFDISIFSMFELGLIAFAAGFWGQLGDLAESMLKRYCNVKDSSDLIPGHGGVLDRMDSILLSGSFLYTILMIFNK